MPLRTSPRLTLFAGTITVAALALTGCASSASGSAADAGGSGSVSEAAAAPTVEVAALEPAVGALAGGTTVTVAGTGFDGATAVASVAFGTEPAQAVDVRSDGELTVVAPASFDFAEGAVPVTVTLEDGTVSEASADYTYEVQTPVDSQMAYAFTHWQDYNLAEWGVFEDNDCGNFVNQAMLQRGWEQSPEWYSDYATTGDYSFSWIRGNPMDEYYASRPDTTRYEFTDRSQLKIGDVVMLDWDPQNDNGVDHTQIISKVTQNADGTISIAMVGHTLDSTYRDLDNAVTVEKPGGTAHFYGIA
ncbi:amidase domain-containing protein [Herbiconiux sp. CPCC 203407]|uniref:Amidase domain-containing protein n=1 Tax=Herbiconiux oxytropis TaxID=2970915 RepID=A0AA41XB20_9MICO|nr:amidase domain-containing protein [Herbiconiux oxytropis]MCS5720729.1 amidase domain-containing protein [Herbiconiux oxytropis]MCS5724944.1 amidase domain-containing protein [Herbiconiux oxytropis]